MAEVAVGLENAFLELGDCTPASTSSPAPEGRRGHAVLVAVIIAMNGEAEARDARCQQAIKKIGPSRGEEKASGHTPGKGTDGQPALHGVEVSRSHAKALRAKVISDGGGKARLHLGERRL
jgi:hypothetical protein